jgi:hypothetical protein
MAAVSYGLRQSVIRLVGSLILGRIKARKRLAQDLVLFPPPHPLGSSIPERHPAFRIHHEHGIVLQAFHDQAESFLALPDGLPF